MYAREITDQLKNLALAYPVLTLVGPRQSGKTTLVRHTFPHKPYANLEALDTRALACSDPRAFLAQYPQGAIFDEIQRAPELLSYIQPLVDDRDQKGLFILTGSHQMELHQAISQSLAGRTVLLTLLPMSYSEIEQAGIHLSMDELILRGGFPRIYKDHLEPSIAYRSYFQTYIERDLRQLIQVKDLSQFQNFIRLLAARCGQIVVLESLAGDVGVSSHTIKHWISILEASFVVVRVPPYFENFGKRLVKSPKIYFTDVGLVAYLLGIEKVEQLSRDPLRGQLVENFVFLELYKNRLNKGQDPRLYFFRDTHGHEVHFVFQNARQLVPIEVKASQTYNSEFLKNLLYFQELVAERCTNGFLIYAGSQEQEIGRIRLLNFRNATQALM